MLQELFRIPGLDWPVYGYGLMLVLGVYAAIELGRFLANRHGINGDYFVTSGLIALAAGVLGARISHVLENLEIYTRADRSAWQNFKAAINLSSGGLTFYGGFILAAVAIALYLRWRKIPVRLSADIVAPCVMLGLAFGRVGCLLNGCCWGQVCDPDKVPWAVRFPYGSPAFNAHFEEGELDALPFPLMVFEQRPDGLVPRLLTKAELAEDPAAPELARRTRSLPVHPTQVYAVIDALLIMAICLAYLRLPRSAGQVFALMLLLYGTARFIEETLRVEPAVKLLGWDPNFSYSMWISVLMMVLGTVTWLVLQRLYVPAPPAVAADQQPVQPRRRRTDVPAELSGT